MFSLFVRSVVIVSDVSLDVSSLNDSRCRLDASYVAENSPSNLTTPDVALMPRMSQRILLLTSPSP